MNINDNSPNVIAKTLRNRWFGLLVVGLTAGTAFVYLLLNKRERPRSSGTEERSAWQLEASTLLRNLRDRAFDADNSKLAVALGRPEEELRSWDSGLEIPDEDVVMKARGIALHRGVDIE